MGVYAAILLIIVIGILFYIFLPDLVHRSE